MFVVHISDGGQQDKEVTVHAEVAPRVRLVEEMEENKGDRLAQFNVLTAEQPSCEGPNCTTANSSRHVAGHWVHTHHLKCLLGNQDVSQYP